MADNNGNHAQWASASYDWNTVTMEAYDARGGSKRQARGKAPACLAPGCNVDLSDAKPYFKRHCVCATHMKAPHVLINGQKMRYCQQCGHFESLDLFIEPNRSCKMSLERRAAISQALKLKGGRSAKSRDQRTSRELSTTRNNTTSSSDKIDGDSSGKGDRRSSPTNMRRLETEGRCTEGRLASDVDMATDSSNTQRAQLDAGALLAGSAGGAPGSVGLLGGISRGSLSLQLDLGGQRASESLGAFPGSGALSMHATSILTASRPAVSLVQRQPAPLPQQQYGAQQGPRMQQQQQQQHLPPSVLLRLDGREDSTIPGGGNGPRVSTLALRQAGLGGRRGPVGGPSLWQGSGSANLFPPTNGAEGSSDPMNTDDPFGLRMLVAPRPPLYSATSSSVLQALSNEPMSIDDPGLDRQLQDILTSARLEGQGWFGPPTGSRSTLSEAVAGGGGLMQIGAQGMRPRVVADGSSGGGLLASVGAGHWGSQSGPAMGGEAAGPASLGLGSLASVGELGAAARRAGGPGTGLGPGPASGGAAGSVPFRGPAAAFGYDPASDSQSAEDMAAQVLGGISAALAPTGNASDATGLGSGSSSGRSSTSFLTCMQYLHAGQGLPRESGAAATAAGDPLVAWPLQSLTQQPPEQQQQPQQQEWYTYRSGEPDPLVRVAIKLTNRAPDELDPTTVASLRKLLSVYDTLQNMQGYIRPGCTELIIDAHRVFDQPQAESAYNSGNGSGATRSDASPNCSGADAAAAALSMAASSTASGSGSWWYDDSSSKLSKLPVEVVNQLVEASGVLGRELVLEALREVSSRNKTALTVQIEDRTLAVDESGTPGHPHRLKGLPSIIAASCAAISMDSVAIDVTLYGVNLHSQGATVWARMHGICYQLQAWRCGDGGVVVRLPMLAQCGVLHLEVAAGAAIGPSYPLLVLPSAAAVEEVHALAGNMGPASLRRFVLDLGSLLAVNAVLSQPLNGVVPTRGVPQPPSGMAAAASTPPNNMSWGSTDGARVLAATCSGRLGPGIGLGLDLDLEVPSDAVAPADTDCACAAAAAAAASTGSAAGASPASGSAAPGAAGPATATAGTGPEVPAGTPPASASCLGPPPASAFCLGPPPASSRRRGGASRSSSRNVSPCASGTGTSETTRVLRGDPTEAMTNADDEQVVELVLHTEAVRGLLDTSLVLLRTVAERNMPNCLNIVVSAILELQERFPDRVHAGLGPPAQPGAFGLMHAAARCGNVMSIVSLLSLEGLFGEHCSLLAKGVHGVTPLHLLVLLPKAPQLLLSLQHLSSVGVEQALMCAQANDGVTPLQLYHGLHLTTPGAKCGPDPGDQAPAGGTGPERAKPGSSCTGSPSGSLYDEAHYNGDDAAGPSGPAGGPYLEGMPPSHHPGLGMPPLSGTLDWLDRPAWFNRQPAGRPYIPAAPSLFTSAPLSALAFSDTACEEWGSQVDAPDCGPGDGLPASNGCLPSRLTAMLAAAAARSTHAAARMESLPAGPAGDGADVTGGRADSEANMGQTTDQRRGRTGLHQS